MYSGSSGKEKVLVAIDKLNGIMAFNAGKVLTLCHALTY
jgi:hypothetical protein